jgi:exonuclease III
MKIISWNVRGLNNPRKQRCLKTLIDDEKPSIMMIQETKCNSITMEKLATKCWKGCNAIAVDVEGASGGLAILWNPNEIFLSHFFTTRHTISAKFQPIGSEQTGYITNVYGPQTPQDKLSFLQTLYHLNPLIEAQPWLLGGDFNIITSLSEKSGGLNRLDQDSTRFKETISDLGLVDLGNHQWNIHLE